MWILYVLPKNLLSRLTGVFVSLELRGPLFGWLGKFMVQRFAEFYQINLSEAEKPVSAYKSIAQLFTRRLAPGVRPISSGEVVHPADSRISQIGKISNGTLVQAKGISYSIEKLTGDPKLAQEFEGGLFITYYLCPTDYHRVHSPVEGECIWIKHIPGNLWPVNQWSVSRILGLFAINERLLFKINSKMGACVAVMVGATNVGKMTTQIDSEFETNRSKIKLNEKKLTKVYSPRRPVAKGSEIGIFHMGSTVVMLYPAAVANKVTNPERFIGQQVKIGEALI